jgi:hypothetical protein
MDEWVATPWKVVKDCAFGNSLPLLYRKGEIWGPVTLARIFFAVAVEKGKVLIGINAFSAQVLPQCGPGVLYQNFR